MAPSLPEAKAEFVSRSSGKKAKRPNYRRRVKLPFTFAELITIAIKESPNGMLTLRDILEHLAAKYECFQGSYVGWKNSVRHNLTINDCFTKVLKDKTKPNAKDNYWALNPDCKAARLRPASPDQQPKAPWSSSVPAPSATSHAIPGTPTANGAQNRPSLPGQPTATSSNNPELISTTPSSVCGFPRADWKSLRDFSIPDEITNFSLYDDECYGSALVHSRDAWSPQYSTGVSTRYHPYANGGKSFGNFRQHHERFAGYSYHSRHVARRTDCCRDGPCFLRNNPIIVPAIRGSLGLDPDEMALSAIERSVQVLDKIRPCDLLSAEF